MAAKSKIILFFVFLALATDLVHGYGYDDCVAECKLLPSVSSSLCEEACSAYIDAIKPGSFKENKFEKTPKLLTGLFNHGVAILEASPNSFIAQGRLDAHAIFFVAQGKATSDLILQQEDKRETLGLKVGDIIWIPSGTNVKLPQPVSTSTNSSHQLAEEGISSVI